MLFTDTKKSLGLVKSEFATVTHIEWLTRKLTVRIDGQDNLVTFRSGNSMPFALATPRRRTAPRG